MGSSKQEKRLAKGLAAQRKAKDATGAEQVRQAVVLAGIQDGIAPTDALAQHDAAVAEATAPQAEEVVAELPELVPDIANPEGVPPQEDLADKAAELVQEIQELEAALTPPAPAAGQPVLQVKQGLTLRGGRGEWYKLLCKYDGRPVAEYIAAGKANPASHYTARSTKCGQPKTPESRLSWFKRAGIVTIK